MVDLQRAPPSRTLPPDASGHWHFPPSRFLHLPLHLGRHGGLPLLLLLDEQFQRRGEHLLVGGSGLNV